LTSSHPGFDEEGEGAGVLDEKAKGLQFDPKVVDAFFEYLKRGEPDESSHPSSDKS